VVPVGARTAAAALDLAGVGLEVVLLDRLAPAMGLVVALAAWWERPEVLSDVEGRGVVGDDPRQLGDLYWRCPVGLAGAAGDIPDEVLAEAGLVVLEPDGRVGARDELPLAMGVDDQLAQAAADGVVSVRAQRTVGTMVGYLSDLDPLLAALAVLVVRGGGDGGDGDEAGLAREFADVGTESYRQLHRYRECLPPQPRRDHP
jgi:hypothetical protein